MAGYLDEGEFWKCLKHPSKRHRCGICPVCLRDRLISLCPDCARERPCNCSSVSSSSSAASAASSSFSRYSSVGIGSVGRVSNLIESEPAFRRSRSLAIPFLRSKPEIHSERHDFSGSGKRSSFWSVFRSKKGDRDERNLETKSRITEAERRTMMRKSRSMAVPIESDSDAGEVKSSPSVKGKGWYFPSPIKAFRHSRVSKLVFHVHSPLYRG